MPRATPVDYINNTEDPPLCGRGFLGCGRCRSSLFLSIGLGVADLS
jgi:hypothetical protein